MPTRLVIKIAVDSDASERLETGLTVAAAAAASGVETSLWLAGDAAWLAVADRPTDSDAAELLTGLLGAAEVSVCARCAARRGITADQLLPGAAIAGAAAFVAAVTRPETQALVY